MKPEPHYCPRVHGGDCQVCTDFDAMLDRLAGYLAGDKKR